jgi:hypothetical protein
MKALTIILLSLCCVTVFAGNAHVKCNASKKNIKLQKEAEKRVEGLLRKPDRVRDQRGSKSIDGN